MDRERGMVEGSLVRWSERGGCGGWGWVGGTSETLLSIKLNETEELHLLISNPDAPAIIHRTKAASRQEVVLATPFRRDWLE